MSYTRVHNRWVRPTLLVKPDGNSGQTDSWVSISGWIKTETKLYYLSTYPGLVSRKGHQGYVYRWGGVSGGEDASPPGMRSSVKEEIFDIISIFGSQVSRRDNPLPEATRYPSYSLVQRCPPRSRREDTWKDPNSTRSWQAGINMQSMGNSVSLRGKDPSMMDLEISGKHINNN